MKLLTVEYDPEDGSRHYFSDGEEISETQWMQQHPHMRGNESGRNIVGGGQLGNGENPVAATRSDTQGSGQEGGVTDRQARRSLRTQGAEDNCGPTGDEVQ